MSPPRSHDAPPPTPAEAAPSEVAANMLSAVIYLISVATQAGFVTVARTLALVRPELRRIASGQPSSNPSEAGDDTPFH